MPIIRRTKTGKRGIDLFVRTYLVFSLVVVRGTTAFETTTRVGTSRYRRMHHGRSIRTALVYTTPGRERQPTDRQLVFSATEGQSSVASGDQTAVEASIQNFSSKVASSLNDEDSFVSLTLNGPKKPNKSSSESSDRLRGCIRQVQGRLIAIKGQKKLQMTIKYHGATDVAKNWEIDQVKLESLLLAQTDVHSFASEWGAETLHPCGTSLGIQRGELVTTTGTWIWSVTNTKRPKLAFHKSKSSQTTNSLQSHDRTKQTLLANTAPFWQKLGIAKADGSTRPKMTSKRKQCQKFVEIVSGLVASCLDDSRFDTISTMDLGCGRGYLTFALHAYLQDTYASKYEIWTRGIDVRPKLVKEINCISESLGNDFKGLKFLEGTIEDTVLSPLSEEESSARSSVLNILIALHACDTASDDALFYGVRNQSDIIVVAPCCHKQLRRQLDSYIARHGEHPCADVLRHNIYRERIAEMVTDSIRALLLEIANYNVQVFEFIGGEHTSKNVMITAVKRQRPQSAAEIEGLRRRLRDLMDSHGVEDHRLAHWMGENQVDDARGMRKRKLSSRNMPPLK
jgi:SAM-dependent methyltransferase